MGGHGPKENCHLQLNRYREIFQKQQYEALNLKELTRTLKAIDVCSYCYTKANINNVDILLTPYNYILVNDIRQNVGLDIREKILIFDEAHNIESVAEDALTMSLKINEIKKAKLVSSREENRPVALIIRNICNELILME